jgi:hypothetical protein
MIKFKMEDLGDVKLCLGLRIHRDKSKSTYALDQTHYIITHYISEQVQRRECQSHKNSYRGKSKSTKK